MEASYNDIQPWAHTSILKTFGAKEGTYKNYQVKTKKEIHDLFEDKEFNAAKVLQFVEVFIPKKDAPRALILTAEAAEKRNAS